MTILLIVLVAILVEAFIHVLKMVYSKLPAKYEDIVFILISIGLCYFLGINLFVAEGEFAQIELVSGLVGTITTGLVIARIGSVLHLLWKALVQKVGLMAWKKNYYRKEAKK